MDNPFKLIVIIFFVLDIDELKENMITVEGKIIYEISIHNFPMHSIFYHNNSKVRNYIFSFIKIMIHFYSFLAISISTMYCRSLWTNKCYCNYFVSGVEKKVSISKLHFVRLMYKRSQYFLFKTYQ